MKNKKQILIIIAALILLIAIPVTLYLVRQTQIFRPKAAFIPRVEFVDDTGSVITETQSPNVKLKITKETVPSPSPSESPSPSPSAEVTPSPSPSPQSSPEVSPSPSPSAALIQLPALDSGS